MSPLVAELLRKISFYRERNRFLSTRFGQMRDDRDVWRSKALDRQKAIHRERVRTRQARASRDLWKHRALDKRV